MKIVVSRLKFSDNDHSIIFSVCAIALSECCVEKNLRASVNILKQVLKKSPNLVLFCLIVCNRRCDQKNIFVLFGTLF